MFKETRRRSLIKTSLWRIIAVLNSYAILVSSFSSKPIFNAVLMNVTGFILYFIFERLFDRVEYGRESGIKLE